MIVKLEELDVNDLTNLKNRIDYILLTKKETSKSHNQDLKYLDFYKLVIEELSTELNTKLSENFWAFKRTPLYKKFKESYQIIEQFQIDNCIIDKLQVKKFQLFGVNLVMDLLKHASVPLGLKVVVNNLHKIPGLVHNAFPDYIENGLLFKVLD